MTTLNRKRHQIAELVTALGVAYQHTPSSVVLDSCTRAGLNARTVSEIGGHFVVIDCGADIDYMEFVAIEPANLSTPGLTGWKVWWRRADGKELFRDGNPVEVGVWCPLIDEAVEVAARWAA